MAVIVSPFPLLLSSQFGESKFREIGEHEGSSPRVGSQGEGPEGGNRELFTAHFTPIGSVW